ncbi:MAG: DinB family protein [Acetobacteraceae bacterium]|nr:DinB family protein [Acetobacteraceae bacterium]
MLEVLDRVGAGDWARVSPSNEGWTIQQILTHLTTSEVGFVPTLRRMTAGEGGVPADFDPDRWNAGQLRRRGDQAPDQLRSELETAHEQMLLLLASIAESALDHVGHMSSGEDGTAEDNFRLVARHKRAHTEDIRGALGVAPPS